MLNKSLKQQANHKGFTLVEIIIGIVVLSISFTIITSILLPTTTQSANQIQQIRAAELGQSMLNEIMSKAFDENSDMAGGRNRCNEDWDDSGTVDADESCSNIMQAEVGETRAFFDDVDDYNGFSQGLSTGNTLSNADGQDISDRYRNFRVDVSVVYDDDYNGGGASSDQLAKRIDVTVSIVSGDPADPDLEPFTFSAYKANF